MDIDEYWRETKSEIDEAIEDSIPRLLGLLGSDVPEEIRDVIAQSVRGGKRVRGMLTCLVCAALGDKRSGAMERARATESAVMIEYIHAASLVLDDTVDGDRMRRGHPAVWTIDNVGIRGAVLIGVHLLSFGVNRLCRLTPIEAMVGARAMFGTTSGVLREFWGSAPNSDDIIILKTGALFGAACDLGAESVRSAGVVALKAHEYGEKCGVAFQIADDLCDVGRVIIEGDEQMAQKIEAMDTIMEDAISVALDAISAFPDNDYTQMLRKAPRYIVDMMSREAQ